MIVIDIRRRHERNKKTWKNPSTYLKRRERGSKAPPKNLSLVLPFFFLLQVGVECHKERHGIPTDAVSTTIWSVVAKDSASVMVQLVSESVESASDVAIDAGE